MKSTIFPLPFWFVLLAFMFCWPSIVLAQETLTMRTPTGDFVTLTKAPCEFSSGWLKLKKALMRYEGKDYKACWMLSKNTIVVHDEAGDVSTVPARLFRPDTGV